jgi:hypothetical protein
LTLFTKDLKKERKDMAIRKHKSFKQKRAERKAKQQPAEAEVTDEVKDAPNGPKDPTDAGASESNAPEEGAESSDNQRNRDISYG